jgi:hypothetical protein
MRLRVCRASELDAAVDAQDDSRRRPRCPARRAAPARARRGPCAVPLGRHVGLAAARPSAMSHCASSAFRLPVTGSSSTPRAGEGAHLELRRPGRGVRATTPTLARVLSAPWSGRSASTACASGSSSASQRGPLSSQQACRTWPAAGPSAGDLRQQPRLHRLGAGTAGAAKAKPLAPLLHPHGHEPHPALLHHVPARGHAAAGQPRPGAAQGGVAGKRQFAAGSEGCARGSRPAAAWAAAGRSSPRGWSSARRRPCARRPATAPRAPPPAGCPAGARR